MHHLLSKLKTKCPNKMEQNTWNWDYLEKYRGKGNFKKIFFKEKKNTGYVKNVFTFSYFPNDWKLLTLNQIISE